MKKHYRKHINKQLFAAALRRIRDSVSILEIDVPPLMRDRIERVAYVFRRQEKDPHADAFTLFKDLARGRYPTANEEWVAAKRDLALYEAVVEGIKIKD